LTPKTPKPQNPKTPWIVADNLINYTCDHANLTLGLSLQIAAAFTQLTPFRLCSRSSK